MSESHVAGAVLSLAARESRSTVEPATANPKRDSLASALGATGSALDSAASVRVSQGSAGSGSAPARVSAEAPGSAAESADFGTAPARDTAGSPDSAAESVVATRRAQWAGPSAACPAHHSPHPVPARFQTHRRCFQTLRRHRMPHRETRNRRQAHFPVRCPAHHSHHCPTPLPRCSRLRRRRTHSIRRAVVQCGDRREIPTSGRSVHRLQKRPHRRSAERRTP